MTDDQWETCEYSGLAKAFCAHCKGDTLGDEKKPAYGNDATSEFEVLGRPFPAQYSGVCTIDYDHRIRRGDIVAKVQRVSNPLLPVSGVACKACIKGMPRADA